MNTDKIIAEKIASEYAQKKTNKLMALKKLDRKAKQTAEIFALIFGVVGALVLGTGMSFAMSPAGQDILPNCSGASTRIYISSSL